MIIGITAGQVEPHTWSGQESVGGRGGLSGSTKFALANISARLAGAGRLTSPQPNIPRLVASAAFVGVGHLQDLGDISSPYYAVGVNFPTTPVTFLKKTGFLTGFSTITQAIVSYWSKLSVCADGMWHADANGSDFFEMIETSDGTFPYFAYDIGNGYYDTLPSDFPQPNRGATSTTWIHVLIAINLNLSAEQAVKTWRNEIDITTNFDLDANTSGPPITNFGDMYCFTDGFGSKIVGDVADFQMWINNYLDFSVAANRELFIKNGIPVNPTIAALTLGTPAILFQGNTTNFIVNQGNGGTFALTGSLTNSGSSPSPHLYGGEAVRTGTGTLAANAKLRMATNRTFAGAGNLSVNGTIV